MAKKKNTDPTMPSDFKVSDLVRLIINMPRHDQHHLLELLDMLDSMPEDEKDRVVDNIIYDLINRDDYEYNEPDDDEEDDDDELDREEVEYPHFLSRPNVQKYTLRVTLRGLKPAIYRKFCVPSNITLRHLSELLIQLMGWEGYHLNQFRKGYFYYVPAYQRKDELPVLFGRAEDFNQEDYTLSDLLSEKGKTLEWEYDFGDSWMHEVRLSSIAGYVEGEPLVTFVKGERECPPEDCGSIWGYAELLELHEKLKAHKRLTADEKDRLEWYGMESDFDPEYFDSDFACEICEDFCE